MARAVRLKVYRTPIGFHDAYVAAPSQKAALTAWGSAHDLFATGEAELVADPALVEEPLATPGEIVRRVRGTAAEHIAALPAEPKVAPETRHARPAAKPKAVPRPPKPDDSAVSAAKAALAAALGQQSNERKLLLQREQDLQREQRALEAAHEGAAAVLRKTIRTAEAAYDKAIASWRRASTT